MRTRQRDWFRFRVGASSVLIASVLLGPAPRAAQRPTLIRNAALILTMDATVGQGELGSIADADVLIDGDTIAAVGKQLPPHGADVVDAAGKIVMPGFVDTHNHLWQSLIRGCGASADLTGWLAPACAPQYFIAGRRVESSR